MKKRTTLIAAILLCSLLIGNLAVVMIFGNGGSEISFSGEAAVYCSELEKQGFPADYATSLTKLHLLHPTWEFVPLQITETNELYTWGYVIEQETKNPETNLSPSGESYIAYRHPLNFELYDSGYYQASTGTVKYFMDPRNFLNEADLFQFYDLSASKSATKEAVDAILVGTFMENTLLQNGKSYAEYLLEVGEEVGIDPVYLAVKLRQEQGEKGTSAVISGTCGSLLVRYYLEQTEKTESGLDILPPKELLNTSDLKALDGHYNPFNIGASGKGVFAIYQNAMERAVTGTSEMASAWGGSPSWDTDWKGIYGGAVFIKSRYIDRFQPTIYLQKFNVDGRAGERNFKNQYMQNVGGALSEGRSFFRSFATNDTLDSPCRFLIPVYDEMPAAPSSDPANGACPAYAAATRRYTSLSVLDHPIRIRNENEAVYGEISVPFGSELLVLGEFSHSYGMVGLEYAWDFGEWTSCSEDGSLSLSFSENLPSYGEHTLVVRGEAAYDANDSAKRVNRSILCAVLTVTVMPPPSVELTIEDGEEKTASMHYMGDSITLPLCQDMNFAGWVGSDGSFLPSGAEIVLQEDVTYTSLRFTYQALEGAALSTDPGDLHLRFCAVIRQEDLDALEEVCEVAPSFVGEVYRNNRLDAGDHRTDDHAITATDGGVWRRVTVCTEALSKKEIDDRFSADFRLVVTYSDGSTRALRAQDSTATRSAAQVALAALADPLAPYTKDTVSFLQTVVS